MSKQELVLIPGMDGTGYLFDLFIQCVPSDLEVRCIPLMQSPTYSYVEQAEYVISQMGNEECILVAESYSGRVAYEMVKLGHSRIKHLVLVASFFSCPSVFARLAAFIPPQLLKSTLMPQWIRQRLLFGSNGSSDLLISFERAVNAVDIDVIKHRLKQVSELEKPDQWMSIPCTYIRPKSDLLVSKAAIGVIKQRCKNFSLVEIEGPHFVLQCNPVATWKVIERIVQTI